MVFRIPNPFEHSAAMLIYPIFQISVAPWLRGLK